MHVKMAHRRHAIALRMVATILFALVHALRVESFASSHPVVHCNFRSATTSRLVRSLSPNDTEGNNEPLSPSSSAGIRLNKIFKATHSRREADRLIESGRVFVNGEQVSNRGGARVIPFRDEVSLDGKVVHGWEKMNAVNSNGDAVDKQRNDRNGGDDNDRLQTASFEYVKYFKPLGVTCTTDQRIEGNIVDEIQRDGYRPRHRVYPVGRLDKETSGLIVLTSDGRMVNAVLRGERKQPKVYKVVVNGRLEEGDLQRLRDGIVIKTVAQRKGRTEEENTLVAKTKQCEVERLGPSSCQMTLVEGRNRQIRKMMEALGFRVVKLHRAEFMGLRLSSAGSSSSSSLDRPGDWAYLDEGEMELVEGALRLAQDDDR